MEWNLTPEQTQMILEAVFIDPAEVPERKVRINGDIVLQSSRFAVRDYYKELERVARLSKYMAVWKKKNGVGTKEWIDTISQAEAFLGKILETPELQLILGIGEDGPTTGTMVRTGRREVLRTKGEELVFEVVEKVAMPLGSVEDLCRAKEVLRRLALVLEAGPVRLSPKIPPRRAVTRPEGRARRELCEELARVFKLNAQRAQKGAGESRGRPPSSYLKRRRAYVRTVCGAAGIALPTSDKALDALMPPVFKRKPSYAD